MKRFLLFCVAMLFAASAGAAYRVPVKPLQEFDVADYGAVSNDGLQDHTAINAAIDAACVAGGGAIVLTSAYDYDIGSTGAGNGINMRCSNITLMTPAGQPPATLRPISTYSNTSYMVMIGERSSSGGTPTNNTQLSNVNVENVNFSTTAPSAYRNVGIYVQYATDVHLANITCSGLGEACVYGYGVSGKMPSDVTVENIVGIDTPSYQDHGAAAVVRFDSSKNILINSVSCSLSAPLLVVDSEVIATACVRYGETQSTMQVSNIVIDNITCNPSFFACVYDGSLSNLGASGVRVTNSRFANQHSYGAVFGSDDSYVPIGEMVFTHNSVSGNLFNLRNEIATHKFANSIFAHNIIDGSAYSGTESGTSTSTTMEQTGAALTPNEYAGYWLECTSGTCADQKFRVTGHDADTFTIDGTWSGGTPNNVTFRLMYDSYVAVNDATASGGSTVTVVDSGAGWTTDQWANFWFIGESGTCLNAEGFIVSNTSDTLTVDTTLGCTPDGTTVYDIQNSFTTTPGAGFYAEYNAQTNNIYSENVIANFAASAFSLASGGNKILNNTVSNTGLNGSSCAVSSENTAYNTGSIAIVGNQFACDAAATGAIAANWSSTSQLSVNDNQISGTALGTAIDAYASIMRGNDINCCVTGIIPRQSVSLVSNNRIIAATDAVSINDSVVATVVVGNVATAAINTNDTADYTVMIGNIPFGSTAECGIVNGGVGANDICVGNLGMKDVLSPNGSTIIHGTTPPATCTVGEIFQDTNAAAADQFLSCTATDTWTAQ